MATGAHCHWQIKDTAQGLADAEYDQVMKDNMLYDAWKKRHPGMSHSGLRKAFVRKYWGQYIAGARATLAHMLTLPIDEELKIKIHESLCLDAELIRGRASGAQILGTMPGPKQ